MTQFNITLVQFKFVEQMMQKSKLKIHLLFIDPQLVKNCRTLETNIWVTKLSKPNTLCSFETSFKFKSSFTTYITQHGNKIESTA